MRSSRYQARLPASKGISALAGSRGGRVRRRDGRHGANGCRSLARGRLEEGVQGLHIRPVPARGPAAGGAARTGLGRAEPEGRAEGCPARVLRLPSGAARRRQEARPRHSDGVRDRRNSLVTACGNGATTIIRSGGSDWTVAIEPKVEDARDEARGGERCPFRS